MAPEPPEDYAQIVEELKAEADARPLAAMATETGSWQERPRYTADQWASKKRKRRQANASRNKNRRRK